MRLLSRGACTLFSFYDSMRVLVEVGGRIVAHDEGFPHLRLSFLRCLFLTIHASAIDYDGRTSTITAPSQTAQERVVAAAYSAAQPEGL